LRVHIIVDRLDTNRILPRKAKYLAQLNRWTVSQEIDPVADLNYFMNYIPWRQRYNNWHETPIGGYFTHRDDNNDTKALWWDDCARAMDLRITSSRLNLQWLPDDTQFARPPVEVDRFKITKPPKGERPVVGVSGYSYGDGRKGEQLIKRLAQSQTGKRLDLRASGRGWPVPTHKYTWEQMPGFFQSLDVLVVPSLYEGVPMPPLEALACGVKVVIPRNVGIMDDLPDIDGIYRYDCGDADDMTEAVEHAAFSPPVDREALRAVITRNYTPATWAHDHMIAVENFLYGQPEVGELPDWHGRAGVYMVAFGGPSRKCAETAITALKTHMPGLPVALVSTEPLNAGEDVFISLPDRDIGGRVAKLKMDELAPADWQYVLYMDADTEVVDDISPLLQFLVDGWELVICRDMGKYATVGMMKRPDNLDECKIVWDMMGSKELFQYNGGMMGFRRNGRTRRLFAEWQHEYERFLKRDQGALLRAIYTYPVRMLVLHNQWNATDRYDFPPGKIAVLHHNTQARRWSGIIDARTDAKPAWDAVARWEAKHGHP
jgi:hypothetical protein